MVKITFIKFVVYTTDIIGTDKDPGLRIKSFAIRKLRGVNYKFYKYRKAIVLLLAIWELLQLVLKT